MARDRSVYRCQQCGFASSKPGTCPDCKRATGELIALIEERAVLASEGRRAALSQSRPRALGDIAMDTFRSIERIAGFVEERSRMKRAAKTG